MSSSPAARTLRLDILLVERGFADNRTQAQALILAGRVRSAGRVLDKPGARVKESVPLDVAATRRWVSRGGEKLHGAISRFGVSVVGRRVLDVEASTGGFTHVLIEAGASEVVALDVGTGQLDWRLRADPRVHVLDGRNARHLSAADLPFSPSLAVVDVSFISLEKVLPAIFATLEPAGEVLALVKPQFEVGRGAVGRGGIVRDPALHRQVLLRLVDFVRAVGASVVGLAPSSIRGAEGNVEFFLRLAASPGGWSPERFATELDQVLQETIP